VKTLKINRGNGRKESERNSEASVKNVGRDARNLVRNCSKMSDVNRF